MKLLFIGSRLYDDLDWYVRSKEIESVLTESNEDAINLDLPDQVFIVPRIYLLSLLMLGLWR